MQVKKYSVPGAHKVLATALNNMAASYGFMNQVSEELRINDRLSSQFDSSLEPEVRSMVAIAYSNAADARIVLAKQLMQKNESANESAKESAKESANESAKENARALLSQALQGLQKASTLCAPEFCAVTLSNLGYGQFLNGQVAQAQDTLRKAVALGGEAVLQALLGDTARHRVEPADTQLESWLKTLSLK